MDTIAKYVLLLALVFCFSLTSCRKSTGINYEIVEIQGAIWASNLSSSYIMSGSYAESELTPELFLPVAEGDLLYMINEDDQEFCYRYARRDGKTLRVKFDTLDANTVSLNDQLKSLELSDDQSSWDLFEQLTEAQRKQLTSLQITSLLSAEKLLLLQEHANSIKGIGLHLEWKCNATTLGEILSICRPKWLISECPLDHPGTKNCAFLSDLELLWIQGPIHTATELIPFCSNLESLIISDWDPEPQELLSLSKSRNLHTVTLAECGMTDLSNMEFPSSLQRLQVIACDTLSQINGIQQLRRLKGISFTGCPYIKEPSQIGELSSLRWLGFPENTSQSEFETILAMLPKLELADLLYCDKLEQLSPLKGSPDLKILILDFPEEMLEELSELSKLELLILPSVLFEENPEWISHLRASLPHTEVVPGGGLCLGSGWILLLLPFVILFRLLFYHRRSSHST